MAPFFPEHWRSFAEFLPEAERGDLLAAYHRRLMDPDPEVHLPAARAWSIYEGACSTLLPSPETVAAFGEDRLALGLARIEAHYFVNRIFLAEDALLDKASADPPDPGGDHPGPLRRGLPDRHRRGPAPGLARGRLRRGPRRRAFGDGAGNPPGPCRGDRKVQKALI